MNWLISLWFGVLGCLALAGTLRSRSWPDRISGTAHVLMCLAMAAMPWPVATSVPTVLVVVLFSAAALWFVGLATLAPARSSAHHDGRLLGYHAVMMAAMAWMAVLMASPGAAGGMPGMEMAGSDDLATQPGWAPVVTLALTLVFAAAAVWFIVRIARPGRHVDAGLALPPTVDLLLSLGMAVGMAGSLFTMT